MNTEILSVSSKGQIVLPVKIRKKFEINTNTKLAANTTGNIIMLRVIDAPTTDDFSKALDKAKKWAKSVGYKKNDLNAIIKTKRKALSK